MKTGIFVALAALALTVFAVPDAHAWGGHHHEQGVKQQLYGGVHVVDVDDEGNTTSLLLLTARGRPGKADTSVRLFWGPLAPDDSDNPRCPSNTPLTADIITLEWVQTYWDGSLLTGNTSGGFLCATFAGLFAAEITGNISGGTKRFKDASGTWTAFATSPAENQGVTGSLEADLD